jgi:hypothetical protein
LSHLALDIRRALHGIHDTLKFDQQPVAGRFHDASAVLNKFGVYELLAKRFLTADRAGFIQLNQP